MEEKRPDPDILLEQVKREEIENSEIKGKGKLKIFLGYSAGVGKTFRMLQESQAAKNSNKSVCIAVVETHGRKETEAMLLGLEIIPRKKVEYSGIVLYEMDIDAVLIRRPSLVLIDELAHTNAPGSRHIKRYQDVEELLNAGIDVFTTINIQHIESMVDVVQQVSGIKISETVPDRILAEASEVELVDLTPEKLIERFKEGKVYIPKKAEQAMKQFFKKGNLLVLRELSLNYTAKQVDEDVRDYMHKNTVSAPWFVGTRLMTGISSSQSSEHLLRFTHKMAEDLKAEWYAVYVESLQQIKMDKKSSLQLNKNIRLAEELGAMVVLLNGTNVAEQMLNFARSKNITLIVAGSSERNWYERFLKGSILDNLIRNSNNINVLIASTQKSYEKVKEYRFTQKRNIKIYIISFFAVVVTTAIGILLRERLDSINIAMILLLPAIASGIFGGLRVALFTSLLAVAFFDFFFIPPFFAFRVDVRYLPAFAVFILVSLIISYLAKSLRQKAESSIHREKFIYSLYGFTKSVMSAGNLEDILNRAVKNIYEAFECNVVIFLPDTSGKIEVAAKDKNDVNFSETDKAVATWVYSNSQSAGRSTNTLSSSLWYYLPLKVQDKTIGVIGLKNSYAEQFLTPDQDQLFQSFSSVVALAIAKSTLSKF